MNVLNGHCKILGALIEKMSSMCYVIGLNIMHPDYQISNPRLKMSLCLVVSYLIVSIYTFLEVYGDYVATVFCLVTLGLYTQVNWWYKLKYI